MINNNLRSRQKPLPILMAEDDEDDRLLVQDAFTESKLPNPLFFVENGEELLDYLYRRGRYTPAEHPLPGLILLDLNMPRKDGREALKEIKSDPNLQRIPIVILTTSKEEEDILRSYSLGISSFIAKPVTYEKLVEVIQCIAHYWFEVVVLPPK